MQSPSSPLYRVLTLATNLCTGSCPHPPPDMFRLVHAVGRSGGWQSTEMPSCYRPQRSWCKVIFSEACVKNSVHRSGGSSQTPPAADTPQEQAPPLPSAMHAGRYGQQAGGTHPTGMHTCLTIWLYFCRVRFDFIKGYALSTFPGTVWV